ncbi:MAG: NlpC/P60 family protein [Ornithinimicrobium sp.]
MLRSIRRIALVVAASVGLVGCANEGWKDVDPDPAAVALVAGSEVGSDAEGLIEQRVGVLLSEAREELGEPYEWGADGLSAWDCSSFVRHAYSEVGIGMPRTARAQRDWMANGNGRRVQPGEEQPGDLVFWDDYRGPDEIGHVAMVWDPTDSSTIEARPPETGHYDYRSDGHSIFEIWRVEELFSGSST